MNLSYVAILTILIAISNSQTIGKNTLFLSPTASTLSASTLTRRVYDFGGCSEVDWQMIHRHMRRLARLSRFAASGVTVRQRNNFAEMAFEENFLNGGERPVAGQPRLNVLRATVRARFEAVFWEATRTVDDASRRRGRGHVSIQCVHLPQDMEYCQPDRIISIDMPFRDVLTLVRPFSHLLAVFLLDLLRESPYFLRLLIRPSETQSLTKGYWRHPF